MPSSTGFWVAFVVVMVIWILVVFRVGWPKIPPLGPTQDYVIRFILLTDSRQESCLRALKGGQPFLVLKGPSHVHEITSLNRLLPGSSVIVVDSHDRQVGYFLHVT